MLASATILPLAACSPIGIVNALTPAGSVRREDGLAYGPMARHRLDLYRPDDLPPEAPLLVFVYGGGWRSGERGEYGFVANPLAGLGCLVAVPDYRLWPEARYPGFVEDTALAVQFMAAREPGRRLVLMGHSAGAFNAACVALDQRWGAQARVKGFIGLAGPYDFGADEVTPPEIFSGMPRILAAPDPLDRRTTPPMLLLHGEADETVRPTHSAVMAARAREAGVPVRHVTYPGMSHIGVLAAIAAPVRALGLAGGDVLGEVRAFVAQPAPSSASST
ncbi:MAG: esterase [Rubritepida sp.]|nr:esterase [Rubritepida sp.]